MASKLKILFAFLTLFVFMETSSQVVDDLGAIIAMQEMDTDSIEEAPTEEDTTREIRNKQAENKLKRLKEAEQYGFTGSDDFLAAPEQKAIDQEKDFFGYSYFDEERLGVDFRNIPVPADYVLGPDDEVKIIFYGGTSTRYTLKVNREGEIFIPEIGPISVAGLTLKNLKKTIEQIVNNQLISTKVSLTLGALKSVNIFVLGEAVYPGMHTVGGLSTLTNAIFSSGGIKTTGSLRNIQLKRNGKVLSTLDFYDLLLKGDTSNDSRVMAGDVVFIPPVKKQVAVVGEVNRPAIYELLEEETLENLISIAGGLKAKANLESIEIQRIETKSNGFSLINVNPKQQLFDRVKLSDGDTVSIEPIINKINQGILLSGHTPNPGYYPWFENMRLSDVINSEASLLPMTDMKYLLIKRDVEKSNFFEVLQINFSDLFQSSDTVKDFPIKNKDELIFFPSNLSKNLIKEIEDTETAETAETAETTERPYAETERPYADRPYDEDEETIEPHRYTVYNYCNLVSDKELELAVLFSSETREEGIVELVSAASNLLETTEARFEFEFEGETLTEFCRNELIYPLLDILNSQASVSQPPKTVTVYGNVSFPGTYPISQNNNLADALIASGGVKDLSFLDDIEIATKNIFEDQVIQAIVKTNYQERFDKKINSQDNVFVKRYSDKASIVVLEGEVNFPGKYPIKEGETLTALIERAGGLTRKANIDNMVLTRKSLAAQQLTRFLQASNELQKNILLAAQRSVTPQDAEYFDKVAELADLPISVESLGRIIVDSKRLYTDSSYDVALKDGDTVIIPGDIQTVSVIGEVYVPNAHFHDPDNSFNDYIDLSGGTTDFANIKSAYVIKGNGYVYPVGSSDNSFFRSNRILIQPGDTIVIPIEVRSFETMTRISEVTQILYQLGLATAAVNSL